MKNAYPENIARFYDIIYHQQRDSVDQEYYHREIRKTKGRILEIGVGTGRLFVESLNEGADIYGIDISQSMLDVLNKKLSDKQLERVSLQNIIDFHFPFQFDLIIAPFRVFMHLLQKKEQIDSLNNIFQHLNHNGKFIFDVFVPDLNQLINGIFNHTDFEGEYERGKKLIRTVSTIPDIINQIIQVRFTLEWDEDDEVKCDEWKIQLRFFFRYELEHLVERSKFSKYGILGDFQGNTLNNKSKEFIIVCRK